MLRGPWGTGKREQTISLSYCKYSPSNLTTSKQILSIFPLYFLWFSCTPVYYYPSCNHCPSPCSLLFQLPSSAPLSLSPLIPSGLAGIFSRRKCWILHASLPELVWKSRSIWVHFFYSFRGNETTIYSFYVMYLLFTDGFYSLIFGFF